MSLFYLIDQLDPRRYAPSILFNAPPGDAVEPFARRGIPIFHEPTITTYPHAQGALLRFRSLRPWQMVTWGLAIQPSARRFEAFLGKHPHDLVHLNSAVQIPAAIGARRAGLPVVWHIREELHPGIFGLRRAMVRRTIDRCADAVVSISQRNAAQLARSPKVRVVYNFLDFNRFDRRGDRASARRALGLPPDRPIILMLGGMVPHKGADVLVEAAALLRAVRPEVLFLVAGIPPTAAVSPSRVRRMLRGGLEAVGFVENVERNVMRHMRQSGLEETVRFLGMRSDIPDLLAAADVLVWPATVSHFSRPVIEAGAMGRPVVASDFPASRELVTHGETGLLVPPGQPGPLADAIRRLVADPEEAATMGEAGWRLACERYDARRNAGAIVSIYEEIFRFGEAPGDSGAPV
jgi:glycosyltransferase involved in cell wall biosynthesis